MKVEKLEGSIVKFVDWLEKQNYISFDQFDFWDTHIGYFGKRLFVKNKILAAPIVLPVQMAESFFPWMRIFFAKKKRFAIGDAHYALGYMKMYSAFKNELYLNEAQMLLDELLNYHTKTESGIGWGYPYIWITQWNPHEKGLPMITVTPYVFEAFLEMYRITNDSKYLDTLDKIAKFVAYDLYENHISNEIVASSYGPKDKSMVVNAVGYRAGMLLKAYKLFGKSIYKEKAIKNMNFVLSSQQTDGSWLYAHDSKFIDNFHTSFVMNKLYQCYSVLKEDRILDSIKKGYDFYRKNFIRDDGTLIHFYRSRYPKFRKIELYDYAEAISLGIMLKDYIEGSWEFTLKIADDLITKFQLEKGYFVTRVSTLGSRNTVPYLRWPQAQLFYALTSLLVELKSMDS